ncbi:hypothetical protein KEM56_004699, partial [Ascosphaera pollenicola]
SSIRYAAQRLTQAAGILLDLPQDVIAHAIVIFTRFWMGPDGGSLAVHSAKDISAAAIYLSAKQSFQPRSVRSVLNNAEMLILRCLGFNLHVTLPYAIALTYLQTMHHLSTSSLTARVIAHLNTALLSPQLVYLTHQANALAVAAIYLAAREVGVKLVEGNWWEVFDVEREELGFLVVAMQSMEGFARREMEEWVGSGQPVPMSVVQLEKYLEEKKVLEKVERGEFDGEKGSVEQEG